VKFYLGADSPHWLAKVEFPLFVSHRRLRRRRTFPRATCDWALDSGGFTELSMHGTWQTTPAEYVAATYRYRDEIGRLDWAAPQDWMCEPWIVDKTGLSVAEHQSRTVENFLTLRDMAPDLPFVPVLQGWEPDDYLRHADAYATAGVDLAAEQTVGLGSVCRRNDMGPICDLIWHLHDAGIRLHGFGVKVTGLRRFGAALASADSMAWSYAARFSPPLPGHPHRHCHHCIEWASRWRARVISATTAHQQSLGFGALEATA
jgi:hypothetical protein